MNSAGSPIMDDSGFSEPNPNPHPLLQGRCKVENFTVLHTVTEKQRVLIPCSKKQHGTNDSYSSQYTTYCSNPLNEWHIKASQDMWNYGRIHVDFTKLKLLPISYHIRKDCPEEVQEQLLMWPLMLEVRDPGEICTDVSFPLLGYVGPERTYNATSVLGEGRFGKVYGCVVVDNITKEPYEEILAMKVLDYSTMRRERKAYEEIDRVATDNNNRCPFILRKIYTLNCNRGDRGVLITELAIGGNMADILWHAGRGLGRLALVVISAQLIDAVGWLHENCQMLHLDVKPDNLLINGAGLLKLCDFGHAMRLPPGQNYVMSQLAPGVKTMHLPPEVMKSCRNPKHPDSIALDFAVDWFAVGVTIFWLGHLGFPYCYTKDATTAYEVGNKMITNGVESVKFSEPNLGEDVIACIKKFIQPVAKNRIQDAETAFMFPCFIENPIFFGACFFETVEDSRTMTTSELVSMFRSALRKVGAEHGSRRVPTPLLPVIRKKGGDGGCEHREHWNPKLVESTVVEFATEDMDLSKDHCEGDSGMYCNERFLDSTEDVITSQDTFNLSMDSQYTSPERSLDQGASSGATKVSAVLGADAAVESDISEKSEDRTPLRLIQERPSCHRMTFGAIDCPNYWN